MLFWIIFCSPEVCPLVKKLISNELFFRITLSDCLRREKWQRQDRIKQYPNIQIYKNDCLFQSFCCRLGVLLLYKTCYSANIYLFKVNNRNTRKGCEVCSKLTIKTSEWRHWHCSGVFIVDFEYTLHPFLVFLLLTLDK